MRFVLELLKLNADDDRLLSNSVGDMLLVGVRGGLVVRYFDSWGGRYMLE